MSTPEQVPPLTSPSDGGETGPNLVVVEPESLHLLQDSVVIPDKVKGILERDRQEFIQKRGFEVSSTKIAPASEDEVLLKNCPHGLFITIIKHLAQEPDIKKNPLPTDEINQVSSALNIMLRAPLTYQDPIELTFDDNPVIIKLQQQLAALQSASGRMLRPGDRTPDQLALEKEKVVKTLRVIRNVVAMDVLKLQSNGDGDLWQHIANKIS